MGIVIDHGVVCDQYEQGDGYGQEARQAVVKREHEANREREMTMAEFRTIQFFTS